jgi:hyperosmotically inducible protein
MAMRRLLIPVFVGSLIGCSMSDQEVKEAAGNAAVGAKRAAEAAAENTKAAYEAASAKGREVASSASKTMNDALLKAKVLAAFKLIEGLHAEDVVVETSGGVVTLKGTVPTPLDKAKVEGVAYGVTGDLARVRSSVAIKP